MRQIKKYGVTWLLLAMIAVYLLAILWINFSVTPSFYDADMYSDVLYALKVREEKNIFPQNWVFGNQLNAVSAPVLAAVIDSVHREGMFVSMAWASTLMTIASLWAFDWMLKPALKDKVQRLMVLVVTMAAVLYCGGAATDNRGWSLFFTMCAYYAGYTIAAFLAFGCYLRAGKELTKSLAVTLVLTCILSFFTGMQSIRQTAIMVVPLAGAEILRVLTGLCRKQPLKKARLITASSIAAANVAGLACRKLVRIHQNEILGTIELIQLSALMGEIKGCFLTILQLMVNSSRFSYVILLAFFVICVSALPGLAKRYLHRQEEETVILFFLLSMGVLVIAGIDLLTTMQVWGRYYFLLFPLIGYLTACCYGQHARAARSLLLAFLVLLFGLSCSRELVDVGREMSRRDQDPAWEISDCLTENGYEYLFSVWGHGEGVAVASEAEIMVGFWNLQETPFVPMGYLYDPVIFEAPPEKCAYLFEGTEAVDIARQAAAAKGTQLELIQYFEEYDWYLFTADLNLMNAYA